MNKFINRQIIKNVTTYNPEIEAIGIEESEKNCYLLYQGNKYSMPAYVDGIEVYKSTLLLRTSDGYGYQFQNGLLTPISGVKIDLTAPMNNQLITSYTYAPPTYECYLNLYDLETSQLVLSNNIPYDLYIEGDVIIAYNNFKGELKRIHTDTTSIWEFPLEQLGELPYSPGKIDTIEKILGVVHGNLWFYTRAGRLVALDIETGGIRKVFSSLENDKERGAEINEGLGCVYLHENTNIYCMGSNFCTTIDTEKCSIIERYKTKESDSRGIGTYESIFNPLLQGDYFTFIGEKKNDKIGCGWAGVFDYKARKLVWECEIITEEERRKTGNELITPQQLFLSNNKLYIEDFLKNLHIFEVDL